MLAASDRGSSFEQEKLIALDEKEQSRWKNKTSSATRSKIEDKGKAEPAEPGSRVMAKAGRSNNCRKQSLARKSRELSLLPVFAFF